MRFFESRAGYAEYLRRFHTFQSVVEQRLTQWQAEAVIPDWARRRRAHLIAADLAALQTIASGGAPRREATGCIGAPAYAGHCNEPAPPAALDLRARPEHILGVAYVLEGATLGGAVLLRSVASLGVEPLRGGSFLSSYGATRGAMWRGLLAILADWEARGTCAESVICAARAAFEFAGRCLTSEAAPAAASITTA